MVVYFAGADVLMFGSPSSWPIGVLPVVCFVLALLHLVAVVIFGRKPSSGSFASVFLLAPSIGTLVAWLIGYRLASQHNMLGFLAVQFGSSLIYWIFIFGLLRGTVVCAQARTKAFHGTDRENLIAVSQMLGGFILVCAVFYLAIPKLTQALPCDRINCAAAEGLFGSKKNSPGMLWAFSILGSGTLFATQLHLFAVCRRHFKKKT